MTELPAPLVSAEVDLSGYQFMPLYGHRLFGSDFNATPNDTAWRAGVTLWWAAWNQVPAASLPGDDAALARLSGLGKDVRTWRKIRAAALHGFVECTDGRLYHRALSEFAIEAWDRRVKERQRKDKWREKKTGQERPGDGDRNVQETGTAQPQNAAVPAERDRDRDRDREPSSVEVRTSTGDSALAVFENDEAAKTASYQLAKGIKRPSAPTELMKLGLSWAEIYATLGTAKTKADPGSYIAAVINRRASPAARLAVMPMGPAGG